MIGLLIDGYIRTLTPLALSLALLPVVAHAAEQGEANVTLHSTITGNQEQPKVLYIVPWQPPGGVDQLQQPVQSLLGDVFAPTDRAEPVWLGRNRSLQGDGAKPEGAS